MKTKNKGSKGKSAPATEAEKTATAAPAPTSAPTAGAEAPKPIVEQEEFEAGGEDLDEEGEDDGEAPDPRASAPKDPPREPGRTKTPMRMPDGPHIGKIQFVHAIQAGNRQVTSLESKRDHALMIYDPTHRFVAILIDKTVHGQPLKNGAEVVVVPLNNVRYMRALRD